MKKSAGTKRCEGYLAKVRGGGKKKAKTSAKKTKGKKADARNTSDTVSTVV